MAGSMPQEGYLLDTSVASVAWDGLHKDHAFIRTRLAPIPEDLLYVCPITLAEVEYGLQISPHLDAARQKAIRAEMAGYKVMPIDRHTPEPYARIRAALFQAFAPRTQRDQRGRRRSKYIEDLIDRTTEKTLGIQENDLWIVAVAVQYDLRFATCDLRSCRTDAPHR